MGLGELLCMAAIVVFLVIPAFLRLQWRERSARKELQENQEAGRTEPVTITPWIDPARCMGSGACVTACPEHVLRVIDGQAHIVDAAACVGHAACEAACPVQAIQLVFGSATRGVDIPEVKPDFESNLPGLYIAGELGGMGLIANAVEQGAQALENAVRGLTRRAGVRDVVIIGAGPAGLSAAILAAQRGLDYALIDQHEVGGAIRHYPRQKLVFSSAIRFRGQPPIPAGTLLKEELVDRITAIVKRTDLTVRENESVTAIRRDDDGLFTVTTDKATDRAQRVIVAIGRRGTPKTLEVPGEELSKVAYWLKDPQLYQDQDLLVVGAGDSAVEAACSLGDVEGNRVWLSVRGPAVNRPRKKNLERLRDSVRRGRVQLVLNSHVARITPDRVILDQGGERVVIPNDFVFVCVGGVLPTAFLQAAGVGIRTHHGAVSEDSEPGTVPSLAEMLLGDLDLDAMDLEDNDPGTDEVPLAAADTAVRTPSQLLSAIEHLKLSDEVTDPLGLPPEEPSELPPAGVGEDRTVWSADVSRAVAEALAEESSSRPGARRRIDPDWSVPEDRERLLEVLADLVGPLAEGSGPTSLSRLRRIAGAVRERSHGELVAAAAVEALRAADHVELERVAALRTQGILALRRGDTGQATDRLEQALRAGRELRLDGADESRTHRWLAECRAVDQRYRSAATHLWNGVSRLGASGAAAERAALVTRQVEIELDLGRPTDALRAADTLLGLARAHPEAGWMATACASVGAVSTVLGDRTVAVTSAVRAADALDQQQRRSWRPAVATARLLCAVDLAERAIPVLEGLDEEPPDNTLVDPEGQILAAQARALARSNPRRAETLAVRAGQRAPSSDRGRAARALLDVAWAWRLLGDDDRAWKTAQAGLRLAYPLGANGLRLDLLSLIHAVRPDDRAAAGLQHVIQRIAKELPEERRATFLAVSR